MASKEMKREQANALIYELTDEEVDNLLENLIITCGLEAVTKASRCVSGEQSLVCLSKDGV